MSKPVFGQLVSPDGEEIVGTLETIPATAMLVGVFQNPDGSFDPEYEGETEIDWDNQATVNRAGSPIYVDSKGNQFHAKVLKFIPDKKS